MELIIAIPKGLELEGLLESVKSLFKDKFRQISICVKDLSETQEELFNTETTLIDEHLEYGMNKVYQLFSEDEVVPFKKHVVIFTDMPNSRTIIAGPSQRIQGVSFIQVNHHITKILGSPQFPVAYELAVSVLRSRVYWSDNIMRDFIHENDTRGCINDFCAEIAQMELKIKTADICKTCMAKLVDSTCPRVLLDDILIGLEEVRSGMYRMTQLVAWEDMPEVILEQQKLKIPSEGIEIHFKPMQYALYVLYARHPEGISEAEVISHYDWFNEFYGEVSSSSDMYQISVQNLCQERSSSRTQARSQIKGLLEKRLPIHLARKLSFGKSGNPAKHCIIDSSSIKIVN